MNDETTTETKEKPRPGRRTFNVNWTRVEGVLGIGALLVSFLWFLGMPTGMAIGVGFGIVLVLDVVRAMIFGRSRSNPSEIGTTVFARH